MAFFRLLGLAWCAAAGLLADGVRLRIVDPHQLPVGGARVAARELHGPARWAQITTDIDGSALLELKPPLAIRAEAPGFEVFEGGIGPAPADTVTIQLRPAIVRAGVEVKVTGGEGSPPGEEALVEIDRTGARTVLDAVESVAPAAFVTRRGVMGYGIATNGAGAISIRGVGEQPNTGVLVIIDGRPDFQGLMGHPLPDFYNLADAGTVNIIEGPASVLYGSNAMGGVIEIKPSRTLERSATSLSSAFGAYRTGQHRLSHGGARGWGFYSLACGVNHTAGERPHSAFRSKDAALSAGRQFSTRWRGSMETRYGHFHVEDPGPVHAPLAGSYARVGRGGFSANLDNAHGLTWGYARLYSSHGKHYLTDGFRSVDRTTGFRLHQSLAPSSRLVLEGGTDVVNYGGRARNVATRVDYGEHAISSAAGFARATWTVAAPWRLNGGARYERNSAFGGVIASEFGAAVNLKGGNELAVEAGRGFRNPTIRELYLFPAPNPLLKPEHMWNYQATFRTRPSSSVSASLTGFYADLRDMIVVTGRFPNLLLRNSGRALNRGVQASVRWRPARIVSIRSGYAWIHSTNLAPYVPAHKLNAGVDVNLSRLFVHFGTSAAGARWADSLHTRRMGRYEVGTARFNARLNRHWSLFCLLDNVFNRRYEVVPGYPMPGLNGSAGLTVNF